MPLVQFFTDGEHDVVQMSWADAEALLEFMRKHEPAVVLNHKDYKLANVEVVTDDMAQDGDVTVRLVLDESGAA